jgi:glycosyltransferase involved in cell wall biosynthesis
MNWLMPGKRRAALLLVANERTRKALPRTAATRVVELPENGVDLGLWRDPGPRAARARETTRFIFLGRLIPLKAVDLLIAAFAKATRDARLELWIVGDGPERARLEAQARSLDIRFLGWLSQRDCATHLAQADALVLPSLHECGGAVVLEAMACAIPVIATAWAGPLDYLDASCGILVEPSSPEQFVEGLAAAMVRLANDPAERGAMGRAGRAKVLRHYDWDAKVERMLELYREVLNPSQTRS